MAGVASNLYQCPVCTNLYECPKFLACCHILCKKCVITCLQRTGGRGECPICHAPILSATPQDQGQLEAQVDNLPTDLATQVLSDNHRILSGPDKCKICPKNVPAQNFCLQCSVKLCTPCTQNHKKVPATSQHTIQKLEKLTVKRLSARHQVKCKTHTQQVVEMYCPSHGVLICCRCAATTHRACQEAKEIADVAKEGRQKFKLQLKRMKKKKAAKQVGDAKQKFEAMRKTAKDVFDDLSESIEKHRRDVNNLIEAEEGTMEASVAEEEQLSKDFALIENLVQESPDDGLLEMQQQLASRLNNLESQMKMKGDVKDVGCLVFDDQIIKRLKSDLEKLGRIKQPQSRPTSKPVAGATPTTSTTASVGRIKQPQSQPTSAPVAGVAPTAGAAASDPTVAAKLQGAALACVLKVGNRVKLAPKYIALYEMVQPGDTGTITAVPSRMVVAQGRDPQGWVDVRWDRSGELCHCMGRYDQYHLMLA